MGCAAFIAIVIIWICAPPVVGLIVTIIALLSWYFFGEGE
jgi:hypothetical protein